MVLINYCVKCLRHSQNINVKCLKGTLSSIAVNPAKHWMGSSLLQMVQNIFHMCAKSDFTVFGGGALTQ